MTSDANRDRVAMAGQRFGGPRENLDLSHVSHPFTKFRPYSDGERWGEIRSGGCGLRFLRAYRPPASVGSLSWRVASLIGAGESFRHFHGENMDGRA